MSQNFIYSVADHIITLREIINRVGDRNACSCSPEPGDPVCDDCALAIRYCDRLRELEREPEGVALLARELAEFKARPKRPIDPEMNDYIPF